MLLSYVKKGQFLFIASFAALIAAGTALLLVPWWTPAANYSWSHALFTATSAVCVTGLTVVEAYQFGWPGRVIILALIQLGGIGIMTLSASILLALGRGLSFSNTLLISGINNNFSLHGTESLTRTVVRYTLYCESFGAGMIFVGLLACPVTPVTGWLWYAEQLWNAVFISVSSFCNAGFSPVPHSLGDTGVLVKLSSSGLTILGGLGVYVIYDLLEVAKKRRRNLRIHSKVVLWTTAILLVGGTALLLLFGRRAGGELSLLDAFFLSASARTAGFSTFPLGDLADGGAVLVIVLMLIGGSSGSTAGGMKTSTVAVAFAAIRNTLLGNREVLMFKRNIGMDTVLRAFTIIVIFILLFCVGGAMLDRLMPDATPLLHSMFEAASALTTTGLSLGATGTLTEPGRLLVVALMFIGRIGPFTIMLFLLGREKPGQLKYPSERVIIG